MDMDGDDARIFWKPTSDRPVDIHLHSNLDTSLVAALSKKIKRHGGNPNATEKDAEVIICRRNEPAFGYLTKKYDHDRYKWVESPSWVEYCISQNKYEHPSPPPVLKRPASNAVNGRTEFTPEEEVHIVHFLAKRIPYKTMKGRSGNKVWKDLCERIDLYPWTQTHTWQSWRERYVKNRDAFDERIEKVVAADPDPPKPGGKGQYRAGFRKPPRYKPRGPHIEEEEQEEEEINLDEVEGSEGAGEDTATPPTKRRRIDSEPGPSSYQREEEEEAEAEEEEEEEEEEVHNSRRTKIPQIGSSGPGRSPLLQANPSAPSSPTPPVPEEEERPHEREVAPTTSQASPKRPAPKPRPKRRIDGSSNDVPAASQRNHSTVTGPDQATTSLMDEDDAPPAFRTRARRQASLEPPTQPALSTRIRTRRVADSPPPAPPPTAATQPEELDLTQLKKRDARKPKSKPALIPIQEVSENNIKVINDEGGSTWHEEMAIEESLQRGNMEIKSMPDDDDSDEVDQADLEFDTQDNLSLQFNEGVKAIAEQAKEAHAGGADASVKRARKVPQTRPHLFEPSSEHSEESGEDSEDESSSEDEGSSSGAQTGVRSLDSQTSVPAVGTNARKYVNARMPFTPAQGTLAEEHVSSSVPVKRTLRSRPADKGKGRAR